MRENRSEFGEPWRIETDRTRAEIVSGHKDGGDVICGGRGDDAIIPTPMEMKRIVACVNFLEGVPMEWLLRRAELPLNFINDKPVGWLSFPIKPLESKPHAKGTTAS